MCLCICVTFNLFAGQYYRYDRSQVCLLKFEIYANRTKLCEQGSFHFPTMWHWDNQKASITKSKFSKPNNYFASVDHFFWNTISDISILTQDIPVPHTLEQEHCVSFLSGDKIPLYWSASIYKPISLIFEVRDICKPPKVLSTRQFPSFINVTLRQWITFHHELKVLKVKVTFRPFKRT